jgi:hypothetical protein
MGSNSERDIVASLLQFHSDRAIANASFLVASMFGLFVVLSMMASYQFEGTWWALALTYWFLWGFGFYSLLNFNHYALNAEVAKNTLLLKHKKKITLKDGTTEEITLELEILKKARESQANPRFHDFKTGWEESGFITKFLRAAKAILLFPLYFFFIGVLPFSAVNGILPLANTVALLTSLYCTIKLIQSLIPTLLRSGKKWG